MKKSIESLIYGLVVALALVALGLFVALPQLSLITSLVYQGF
jgi:biopolymer transport protein ExbB/TolQ